MRPFPVLLSSGVILCAVAAANAATEPASLTTGRQGGVPGTHDSMREICGVNALYMFLRLRGSDASFAEVWDALGNGTTALSLHDLNTAATALGLPTTIRQCGDGETLASLAFPVILYMPHSETTHSENGVGHFVVVLDAPDTDHVTVIDGTSAQERTYRISYFQENGAWTGHVLLPAHPQDPVTARLRWAAYGFAAVDLLLLIPAIGIRWRRSSALLLCVFLFFGHSARSAGGDVRPARLTDGDVWRSGAHDATNCLVLLMRLNDHDVDYDAVQSRLSAEAGDRPVSLAHIRSVARSLGFNVDVVAITPDELGASPPGVILMAPARSDRLFCLYTRKTDGNVGIISGSFVIWSELDPDVFLDDWTGHILIATPQSAWNADVKSLLGLSLIACVIWMVVLFRRHRLRATNEHPS